MLSWRIIEGDCCERLQELDARSVQTCITSPPYFGLRDYGVAGQLGLEATPDEFVKALVTVFREVRRVLRDDGTVWLNLGDSYAGTWGNQGRKAERGTQRPINGKMISPVLDGRYPAKASGTGTIPVGADYKAKDLLMIPAQVALALRADGWYLRSDIIWQKPSPMPESVTDRPTSSHEHIFLLAKRARYYYDADAIREPVGEEGIAREGRQRLTAYEAPGQPANRRTASTGQGLSGGRNKRNVWTVATQGFSGAHFATFPPKLIEPCILAGSSPKACGVCGAPWQRVTEREDQGFDGSRYGERAVAATGGAMSGGTARSTLDSSNGTMTDKQMTTGWEPTCDHDDDYEPGDREIVSSPTGERVGADSGRCVVLDPFAGAGTTGVVALRHDRSFIGIELNPAYAEMARDRIRDDAPLLNAGIEATVG